MKDRQHNSQKKKDKQHLQNIIQKTASLALSRNKQGLYDERKNEL